MAPVETPAEKWSGSVREVTLGGGTRSSVTVGGETTLPFLDFDGAMPHRPVRANEIEDR